MVRVVVHDDAGVGSAPVQPVCRKIAGLTSHEPSSTSPSALTRHEVRRAHLVPPQTPRRRPEVVGAVDRHRHVAGHVLVEADAGEDPVEARQLLALVELDAERRHRPRLPRSFDEPAAVHACDGTVPRPRRAQAAHVTCRTSSPRTPGSGPTRPAYVTPRERMTWREYHDAGDPPRRGARAALGLERGAGRGDAARRPGGARRVRRASERPGCVIVGIGPRAGDREIEHLLTRTGARAWITDAEDAALAAASGHARGPDAEPDAAGRGRGARRSPTTRSGCSTRRRAPPGCRSA